MAYKAFYSNGKLADQNFNASSSAASVAPRPIAGKQGTTIVVEDLFYNAPARAKATKSKNEEFIKILDVVGRYAVHSPVGFSCKKFGDSHQALTTRPKLSLKDRIRTVYGSSIANELMEFEMDELERGDTEFGLLECLGAVTNSNYINKKKQQPVIFINDRSVACDSLKRSLMSIYAYFLPKGNQPFMYLNLKINPAHVDVNVHPTKREVRFLNEDEIIDVIGAKIHSMLSKVDTSRTFKTQSVLMRNKRSGEGGELVSISAEPVQELQQLQPTKKYRQENKLVRTDSKQLKLHTFMKREVPLRSGERNLYLEAVVENVEDATSDRVEVNLSSILRLTEDLVESTHKGLTEVFNGSTYVGIVDELRRLCSFQFGVKLYICDYASILNEFYYQIALGEFNNFGEFTLLEPLLVEEIIGPLSNMASTSIDVIVDRIVAMREMLEEYFNLKFDQLGQLYSLPMILKTIEPQISKLPYFIYRLGTNINYENEMECLEGILREIALLYIPEAIPVDEVDVEQRELNTVKRNELNHELENHIFPLLRQKFIATGKTVEDVMEIADLPGLYKVFERC